MKADFKLTDFISDSPIYTKALTLANNGKAASYERLEFLGDRVLGLILADMLYHRFPAEKEGEWAMRFTILAQEKTLAAIAKEISLPDLLITHENELRQNNSILSDVLEALIAAIYLDKGIESAKQFIEQLWEPYLHQSKKTIKDSKSALQELAQKYKKMPVYTTLSQTGPDHAPTFTVQVEIIGLGSVSATGSSKKEAEATGAKMLLEQLQSLTSKGSKK